MEFEDLRKAKGNRCLKLVSLDMSTALIIKCQSDEDKWKRL